MPVKRSLESFGAIASMTRWMWSLTSSNSTAGRTGLIPNGPLVRNASARLPAAIIAFDGTQPVLRHSPPMRPFSISTTGTPSVAAAAAATDSPPEPAPMTQRSGVSCSAMPILSAIAWVKVASRERRR